MSVNPDPTPTPDPSPARATVSAAELAQQLAEDMAQLLTMKNPLQTPSFYFVIATMAFGVLEATGHLTAGQQSAATAQVQLWAGSAAVFVPSSIYAISYVIHHWAALTKVPQLAQRFATRLESYRGSTIVLR